MKNESLAKEANNDNNDKSSDASVVQAVKKLTWVTSNSLF